eukprot:COSAG01_NODE_288_length_19394_cov_29.544960_16_plen_215_part_00
MPRLVTFDPQVRVEGLGHGDLMGLEQRGDEEAYDVQLRRQAIDLLRQRRAARLQLAAAAATNAADAAANKRQGTTTSPLSCTTHNPVAEEYDGAASTAQEAQAKTTADRRWRLLCAALCMGLLLLCVAGYFIAIELTAQKLSRNGACDFNLGAPPHIVCPSTVPPVARCADNGGQRRCSGVGCQACAPGLPGRGSERVLGRQRARSGQRSDRPH